MIEEKTNNDGWLRRMGVMLALALAAFATIGAQAPAQDNAAQAARARELIKQARAALGGEEVLSKLGSLSASGKLRRFLKYVSVMSPTKVEEKEKTLSGKVKIDFLLPDKFRRQVSVATLRGFKNSYVEVVNGDRAWRKPPLPVASSANDRRVIDVGDVERSFARQARNARQQMALYTFGWLLQSPSSLPIELSYAGVFEAEDRLTDVIVAQGQDDYRIVLLLDQKTHLPHTVALSFVESRRESVIAEVAGISQRFIRDTYARARAERAARTKPPQRYELRWRFSDHRPVAGLLLPHRITATLNGEMIEELTITEFALNHHLNLKKFEGQPEEKY